MTKAAQHDQQSAELDDDDPDPPAVDGDLPRNASPTEPSGTPKPTRSGASRTPDSRITVRDGAFAQAYSAQIDVDEAHQIIVAAALSDQAPRRARRADPVGHHRFRTVLGHRPLASRA